MCKLWMEISRLVDTETDVEIPNIITVFVMGLGNACLEALQNNIHRQTQKTREVKE